MFRLAYWVFVNVTSTSWFETLVLLNIFAVAVATGLDLENNGRDPWVSKNVKSP